MKIKYNLLSFLVITLLLVGCNKEDDGLTRVEEADRGEQQIIDNDSLVGYLETHYFNSMELMSNSNPSMDDIIITKLEEGESVPIDHTLLINAVETYQTVFEETNYDYYVLRINQGGGDESPNFADSVRLNYRGNLQDETVFDSSVTPVVFDLTNLIPGWSRVIPQFNTAESFVLNGDGTVSFDDAGVGMMFIPSGLAYFSGAVPGVPVYSNLIFRFELFQFEENDHDQDGIPSYLEDIDDDTNLADDDSDEDNLANFVDVDDDNDGVLTINELIRTEYTVDTNMGEEEPVLAVNEFELSRSEENGIITIITGTIIDADNNGIDDYLDEDVATDYTEE